MIFCCHYNNNIHNHQNLTFFILQLLRLLLISSIIHSHHVMVNSAFIPSSDNGRSTSIRSSFIIKHSTWNFKLYALNKNFNNGRNKVDQLPIIPVIGPILTAPPLMIGAEMVLDPPTPLQWKALQESVVLHRNQLRKDKKNDSNQNDNDTNNASNMMATIDAAPLIAIIDEVTGTTKVNPPYSVFAEGGRYATLAAVVGITTKKMKKNLNNNANDKIEDEESFMEYMDFCSLDDNDIENENDNNNDFIVPMSSSVRLVGVGRAVLRKLFYQIPTDICDDEDEDDDNDNEDERSMNNFSDNDDDDDDEVEINFTNGGYDDGTPIVMSRFEPLVDDSSIYSNNDPNKIGEKGQRSYRSSPVHALTALFNIANRVSSVHDDRRKLVAGIKAAKARLKINKARKKGKISYDDDLEDLDGLGALFDNYIPDLKKIVKEEEGKGMTVDEFLATFQGNMKRIDPSELPQNQPSPIERLEASENYGMSYYGSFSTISELTAVTVKFLEPYYSEKYREREENDAEISSFVVFRALEGFIDNEEIANALKCTSSVERLMRGYELMVDHKIQLKQIAEKISDELRDCGEECTDLW